jgi:hypothetical protein
MIELFLSLKKRFQHGVKLVVFGASSSLRLDGLGRAEVNALGKREGLKPYPTKFTFSNRSS